MQSAILAFRAEPIGDHFTGGDILRGWQTIDLQPCRQVHGHIVHDLKRKMEIDGEDPVGVLK